MGRSSIRKHKQNILIDRVIFQPAQNITQKYTSIFLGKRQLISDNQLRPQLRSQINATKANFQPEVEDKVNKNKSTNE